MVSSGVDSVGHYCKFFVCGFDSCIKHFNVFFCHTQIMNSVIKRACCSPATYSETPCDYVCPSNQHKQSPRLPQELGLGFCPLKL